MVSELKEKPIKGLKIKYNNEIYEKIIYFSVSNWDKIDNVSFTNKDSNNKTVNIHCEFKDIEIIKE